VLSEPTGKMARQMNIRPNEDSSRYMSWVHTFIWAVKTFFSKLPSVSSMSTNSYSSRWRQCT